MPNDFDIHDPAPIVTTYGGAVDILNPTVGSIDPVEMAVSLVRKGRYTDLSNIQITVAGHLVLCDHLAELDGVHDPETRLHIFLHDAHEAYTGDIARPMKRLLEARTGGLISQIETGLDRAIFGRLGLPAAHAEPEHPVRAVVKKYDNLALAHEVHWLFPRASKEWVGLPEIDPTVSEVLISRLIAGNHGDLLQIFQATLSRLQTAVYGAPKPAFH